jgi:glycosyltransferase involved in cell wall biosynthesis
MHLGEDIDFRVVTQDRDSGDSDPFPDIAQMVWMSSRSGMGWVLYIPPARIKLDTIEKTVSEVAPDYIYLNSFFDRKFTLRVLLARRLGRLNGPEILLAPRGELSPGALGIKRWRKRLYLVLVRLVGLYRGLSWHASTGLEAAEIAAAFPPARQSVIHVARNLPPVKADHAGVARPMGERLGEGPLRICFLSRIVPKKNLEFALRVLEKVRFPVEFTIYGPLEERSYWEKCAAIMNALPSNVNIHVAGEVPADQTVEVLSHNDVFLLPTLGENYGHVIYEALAAGLFVVISDRTPWNQLKDSGVGAVCPLDCVGRYVAAIEYFASMPAQERERIRHAACAYAHDVATDAAVVWENRALFLPRKDNETRADGRQ